MRVKSIFSGLVLATALLAPRVGAEPNLSAALRQEVFQKVWQRVKEVHYDPKYNGADWDDVRKRYAPKAAVPQSDQAFYDLLEQMLGELKQSHYAIIPPSAPLVEEAVAPSGEGEIGAVAQLVEGKAILTQVESDSPAARAGLKPGYAITHVDGKPMQELIARLKARKMPLVRERLYAMMGFEARMRGGVGTTAQVRYLDAQNKSRSVSVMRRMPKGETTKFGEMPEVRVAMEKRRLANNVGYIRFNLFMLPLLEPIKKAVREMEDAPGFIIDLRGNHGGVGAMAYSIAGLFYDKRSSLGTMKMRRGEINFVVYPQTNPFTKPLILLTDEASLSTSEILAGSLQENGRAVIVGRPTGGMVLPSQFEALPGGARFQYAIADFKTPKGVLLEGRGVLPNVPVELTRQSLLKGSDPMIAKALELIRTAKTGAGTKENVTK